ncbi:MAG TPA: hypothetical protein VGK73_22445 [Polyangiaceae bacterium]
MSAREKYWLVVALAIVASAIWLVRRGSALRPSAVSVEPLAVVPAGPAFVLSVDLARLRKSKAGLALARAGSEELAKAGKTCGFEPLRDVDQLALAVPGSAKLDPGAALPASHEIAVIASGRFVGPVVVDCIARQIQERGGEPVRTTIGSFASVRDRRGAGEIAVKNGLFVLSDGPYLRRVLDAAEGHRADGNESERVRDRLHAELRRSFGGQAPIIATLALPEGWLEQALGDPEVRRSPLALLRSAALRAEVSDRVELRALFACAKSADCDGVEAFLKNVRADLGPALGPALSKRLAEVSLQRNGERIELSGAHAAEETRALFAPR